MRWRVAAPAAALVLAVLGAPAAARGEGVSAAELRSLAARAATDAGARDRLRRIDRVDGRPFAVGRIVAGAQPDEVAARVGLALDSAARPDADAATRSRDAPGAARERARELLRDRRFTGTSLPRPFTGALRWIGERLEPVAQLIDAVGRRIPGGTNVVYVVLCLLAVGFAALVARRSIRRGAGRSGLGGRTARAARGDDPGALERAADAAESDGRWEEAVRLRFRAGLLRLDAGATIAYRPSLTTGEVARALASPDFDALGRDFDAIAYGGRAAAAQDAAAARERWATVLASAGAGATRS